MGEIIKKIGKIHIGDSEFDVELNEANYFNGEKIIHVQNERVRYAFDETDFVKVVTSILKAEDHLNYYKRGDINND